MRSIWRTPSTQIFILAVTAWTVGPSSRLAHGAVIPLTFTELTQKSKLILTGEVISLRSYRAPFHDAGEVTFTDVTIRIDKVFKGAPADAEITIQVLGGQIGERWQKCPESPVYEKGEKVLVFVREYNGALWNSGWFQGKYKLDPSGSQAVGAQYSPISVDTKLAQIEAAVRAVSNAGSSSSAGTPPGSLAPASGEAGKGGSR